ncbi:hypothetical protein L1F30_15975 [Simiduia sp. 21SJ11W-1]|uniref:hypothetical protein n=1 Tax=Simiduia sp. 21SJ11W-1 TaxID=2909669 RepID=UPI0020A1E21F|nr:hypothetical protein [Simiduia sp. 21SJ11W-1]UTA47641.1 hypothetical protein L1F30_15975 [Simiduia sp. 21SJ11W-1]
MLMIIKRLLVGLAVCLWCVNLVAAPAAELNAVIVAPFTYAESGVPQNVLDEMALDQDVPRELFKYIEGLETYRTVALGDFGQAADVYVTGRIQSVEAGNGAERYFGSIVGAGRSAVVVRVQVFNKDKQLLYEGGAVQVGARGGSMSSVFSNKKNIASAVRALPRKLYPIVIAGGVDTPEGIIRAFDSKDPRAIQLAAKGAHQHKLQDEPAVKAAMAALLSDSLNGGYEHGYAIDGLAWCAINLGAAGDATYKPLLEEVVASELPGKVRKHAKAALKKLASS